MQNSRNMLGIYTLEKVYKFSSYRTDGLTDSKTDIVKLIGGKGENYWEGGEAEEDALGEGGWEALKVKMTRKRKTRREEEGMGGLWDKWSICVWGAHVNGKKIVQRW